MSINIFLSINKVIGGPCRRLQPLSIEDQRIFRVYIEKDSEIYNYKKLIEKKNKEKGEKSTI